jgi:transcriptional regulator with XRE-family HTH domain
MSLAVGKTLPMICGMPDTDHTPASLRVRLGFTQQELADKASVDVRTVRNAEDGENLTIETAEKLAKALGVTRDVYLAAYDVVRDERKRKKKASA